MARCFDPAGGARAARRAMLATLCFVGLSSVADHAAAAPVEGECLINVSNSVKLGASVQGVVTEMRVERGSRVRAGDVIALIDPGIDEANVAIARLRAGNEDRVSSARHLAEYRRRRAERFEALRANRSAPEAQIDEAATDAQVADAALSEALHELELARLELARAEQLLDQRHVRSPIDGIVTERALAAGEYRHEQAHLVTLVQLNPLHVETFLPISEIAGIAVGQTATIEPEEPVGGAYKATVTVVDRVFDAASGTFGVRLELPNADYALPAGLRCRISFDPLPLTAAAGRRG